MSARQTTITNNAVPPSDSRHVCIWATLSTPRRSHTGAVMLAQAHIYRMKCTHRGVIIADRKSMSFGFCYLRRSVTCTHGLHTPGSSVWHKKQPVDTETQKQKACSSVSGSSLAVSSIITHNSLKYNQIAWLVITEKRRGLSFLSFVLLSFDTFRPRAKLKKVPPARQSSPPISP